MRILLLMVLGLGALAPISRAQAEESCGPKSALCWPVLKRGSSGPRVVALQYLLLARGYKLAPDGKFAAATESALRKFQAKNRLQVDGKVGWQSWEAITPDLKRGAKGNAVKALQTLLVFQKQKVAHDGIFGSATQKALDKFPFDVEGDVLAGGVGDVCWCCLSGGRLLQGD